MTRINGKSCCVHPMSAVREVSPTGTYSLNVPARVQEQLDADVASYWVEGDDVLFQLSSRIRRDGPQVSAIDRLRTRLRSSDYADVLPIEIGIDACQDVAATSAIDADGLHWLFVHAVWPTFSVFMTVSYRSRDVIADSWALAALRSIKPARS